MVWNNVAQTDNRWEKWYASEYLDCKVLCSSTVRWWLSFSIVTLQFWVTWVYLWLIHVKKYSEGTRPSTLDIVENGW